MSTDPTPLRSHRRTAPPTTRGGRIAWRTGQAIAILATLVVGTAITKWTPDIDTQQRPFIRAASVGHVIDARTFNVTVLGVRGGALLADINGNHDTSGVWIVIRMKLDARRNPVAIGYAVLKDADGRTYRATGRIDQSIIGHLLEPGVPIFAEMAFEVPAAGATDMSLQLGVQIDDQRMDTLAQVHLPITAAQEQQWRADKKPLTLAPITERP